MATRRPRAVDTLAADLRRRVLEGELAPGTLLPNERELAEQTGFGRSSVREALRSLEIQGLVETRQGRGGGTRVVPPTQAALSDSVRVFIQGNRLSPYAVAEVRAAVEPACAALAAQRATATDLDALRALTTQMRSAAASDTTAYLDANVDWHVRVAEASGNVLFAGFLVAVSEALREATDIRKLDRPEVREAALHAHDRILEAIAAGRPEVAQRRMAAHVHAYGELILAPEHVGTSKVPAAGAVADAPSDLRLRGA